MAVAEASAGPALVSLRAATGVWLRIGLLSFGGPAGQIALMHRMVVEERSWLSEARFLAALNYCMLLPGPEAQQLATYLGWRLNGVAGGIVAGTLFILPGVFVMLALSAAYVAFGTTPTAASVLLGVKAAVIVIIAQALARLATKVMTHPLRWVLAGAAWMALSVFGVPFPVVVVTAGIIGALLFNEVVPEPPTASNRAINIRSTQQAALATLALWALLVGLAVVGTGEGQVFDDIAYFFSKLAVVTFGGAYAVLAYMADQAVSVHGWLTPTEMVDGLGLAETTPGPLILVTQFVGFLAGFRNPGALDPWLAGLLGAGLTIAVTFLPSFLWIFAGAPHVEALIANRRLRGALAGVTTAVVGVIASLALWFAARVFFQRTEEVALPGGSITLPDWTSIDETACIMALLAAGLLFGLRLSVPLLVAVMAGIGLAAGLIL